MEIQRPAGLNPPVTLNPVDRIEVLTVIDDVLDVLLGSTEVVKRIGVGDGGCGWQQRRVAALLPDYVKDPIRIEWLGEAMVRWDPSLRPRSSAGAH